MKINLYIYKNLSPEVYKLAIIRFFLSMGNFISPFMTLLLVKKLLIPPHIASLFVISAGFMFIPASILSGKISDKIGRKFVLLLSFSIYILIIFIIFLIYQFNIFHNVIIAILLIFANLFISMTQAPIAAIITDVTEPSNRNESFSLVYLAVNVGFAFGPLIAGFLFENYTTMIFLGNGIASLIGLTILTGIKETRPNLNMILLESNSNNFNINTNKYHNSSIKFILNDKVFFIFILATIFYSFTYSQVGFTLPIFLTKLFDKKGAKYYGILQSTNAISVILFTPLISILARKRSPFLMVSLAGVFYAFGFGLYFLINSIPMLILTTVIWSIGEILQITNQNVFIANRTPTNIRGRINGTFQILNGLGFMLGPVFSGFFQKHFPINFVWIVVFIISFIGSIELLVSYFKMKSNIF
ncbi:MAG: MFS transporter [Spirochaetes bacterium]|nr:MFS transporter [Spirochaetota bacterium]